MPNLFLQYSDNVEFDSKTFFRKLHEALVATGEINMKGLKSRATKLDDYYIADGDPEYKMVYLDVILREGRSKEVREKIAQAAMAVVEETFGHYKETGHIVMSTDMKELEFGVAITNYNIPDKSGG